jgi:RNA polymerase sigma factor (sigma-70 family)
VQELNSHEFITKLKAGDNEAFGTLFTRLLPKLSYFISKWFNIDPGEAEELASDALAKVHRSVSKFDPHKGAKLTTWIYTIAKNTTRDYLRKQSHSVHELPIDQDISIRLGKEAAEEMLRGTNREIPKAVANDPEDGPGFDSVEKKRMMAALASLKEADRNILHMRQVMEYEEIAAIEGTSVNALRTRYSRAVERLEAAYEREKADDSKQRSKILTTL